MGSHSELDQFTVARLEEILNWDLPHPSATLEETLSLAQIALSEKQVKPVDVDKVAYDMARGIMALVNETSIGGACQLQAKIQCFISEKLPPIPQAHIYFAATTRRIAPHLYSQLVNMLRDIAIEFHDTDQLRDVISRRLAQYIAPDHPHTRPETVTQLPAPSDETLCEVIRAWNRADIPRNAYPEMRKALGYPVEGSE
ncbi:Uncharacterised protein [Yersinia frederiksenii]|uniref:hypothetical protein n=1 Tax=Yersinia frederiksenii TaxID=29484 RepID=UPI0005DBB39D|nr:hypothetical protein [Yersinia frederiksenii]CND07597.1 Uncharacterised protein [Yersinia frederiksenii]